MPQVYSPDTIKPKHVKSLGWLQRHLDQVVSVSVIEYSLPLHGNEGVMTAVLKDGRSFRAEWGSLTLCAKWLSRPSLYGVSVWWINHTTTCDQLAHYHFGGA